MADIDPKLKPLCSSLLELKIEEFLVTSQFERVCLYYDIGGVWKEAQRGAGAPGSDGVLLPDFKGSAREALPVFLGRIVSEKRYVFLNILDSILRGFVSWSEKPVDLTGVRGSLKELGFNREDIDSMGAFGTRA